MCDIRVELADGAVASVGGTVATGRAAPRPVRRLQLRARERQSEVV
jgi:hypothetical protein